MTTSPEPLRKGSPEFSPEGAEPSDGALQVVLMTNGSAGRGAAPAVARQVAEILAGQGIEVHEVATVRGSDPGSAARELLADLDAFDAPGAPAAARSALIAVGGDGTMNIGLNLVAGTPVALGVVAAGTGNDVAAEWGFTGPPEQHAARLGRACRQRQTRLVDAVRWSDDAERSGWFAGVCGMGFDSLVNERANGWSWPRGRRRYDLAVLRELGSFSPRRFDIDTDSQPELVNAVLVAVGNTAQYGGGLRICDGAVGDDGLLDLVVVGEVTRRDLIRMYSSLPRGEHLSHPKVSMRRARQVRVSCEGIVAYADGERLAALPLTFTVVPGAVRLLDGRGSAEVRPA